MNKTIKEQEPELLPCPFCGKQPECHSLCFRTRMFGCPDMTCPGNSIDADKIAWNTRATRTPPDPPADAVDRAKAFCDSIEIDGSIGCVWQAMAQFTAQETARLKAECDDLRAAERPQAFVDDETARLQELVHKSDGLANEINILTKENRQLKAECDELRAAGSVWHRIETDGLPKKDGRYLVTVQSPPYATNPDPKNNKASYLDFWVKNGCWSVYGMVVVARSVIAWSELLEPYVDPVAPEPVLPGDCACQQWKRHATILGVLEMKYHHPNCDGQGQYVEPVAAEGETE